MAADAVLSVADKNRAFAVTGLDVPAMKVGRLAHAQAGAGQKINHHPLANGGYAVLLLAQISGISHGAAQ